MRSVNFFRIFCAHLFLAAGALGASGADDKKAAPSFKLAPIESSTEASKFTDAQRAFVQSWIRQIAPECPAALTERIAENFLDELSTREPQRMEQLGTAAFPTKEFDSMLLRFVGAALKEDAQKPQREAVARRRVQALLALDGAAPGDPAALIEKVRDASSGQHRRLIEGRLDDDELRLLLKKVQQPAVARVEPAPAAPKVLTAADIVTEFQRHNQAGAALQHLRAYAVEARLHAAGNVEEQLLLFKMRPDRFRLVIRSGGRTMYVMAFDGERYWQQAGGRLPQIVPPSLLKERRYLTEFVDLLMEGEGCRFEKLADGETNGKKCFRLSVQRPDGSKYISRIDPESFRELGRENEDGTTAQYSDFREVAGVLFAFREEVIDHEGRTGRLEISRITPNPGLIRDFFAVSSALSAADFEIEREMAADATAGGPPKS